MQYIEAPAEYTDTSPALFLAGGISDAENWQRRFVELLPCGEFVVLNPRRLKFPKNELGAQQEQIAWEYRHLERADFVAFWFPPQTVCPIALFELGACCAAGKPMAVGCDPAYSRRLDVETQLRLRRPEVCVVHDLEALAEQVARLLEMEGAWR